MWDIDAIRREFPALQREVGGQPVAFFDGPAGSQVPQRVADAVSRYLLTTNANHGGCFATAEESDVLLDKAHLALSDFLGAGDPDCVFFGANMTSLTFALSRALSQIWSAGDEILVTQLDHDANVTPWVLAARDAGVTVKPIEVNLADGTLNLDDFARKLSPRTKLVAVGYASNIVGTINPVAEIVRQAHDAGALVFVDAVHYAPHELIDVQQLDCDFLACSAYKFFGPHIGVMYGKRALLEELTPYKLRPATNELPGKWMSGTQSHEGIAGAAEAVRYLADLGRSDGEPDLSTRSALQAAFSAIKQHEHQLTLQLLDGLSELPGVRVWGITDHNRMNERVPTISITHERLTPAEIATELGNRGLFVWHGNHYALPFTEAAGLEPGGTLRIGILHYNTAEEIEWLLTELRSLVGGQPAT